MFLITSCNLLSVTQIVYELPTTAQWSFDVRWCPRNPAMICTSSFDGHVSVYSLMGGSPPVQEQQKVRGVGGGVGLMGLLGVQFQSNVEHPDTFHH